MESDTPETTEISKPRYRYQHVVFNHALGIERLLSEHTGTGWQLVRIVPYTQYESVMVLELQDV